MLTLHSVSAAYVKARQAEELQAWPKPIDPHATFKAACEMSWKTSCAAVDETAGIQDKEQVK